jgi:hypothetical protein
MRGMLILGALLVLAIPAAAKEPVASLDQLAWIAGHWEGEMGGALSEEMWSAPSGDGMMGMWRLVMGGKVRVYEFLVVEQEASGPVLKFKHFNRGLVGWEEKDQALVLPLVKLTDAEAVFDNGDAAKPLRLIYKRPSAGELVVVLERMEKGKLEATEFRYRRK